MIHNYNDFITTLFDAGFSMGGSNDENIFSVASQYSAFIQSHTDDPETDPWEWRMRVLDERDDIAYAKLFFKKSGYITKEWYPYFFAARRGSKTIDDEYTDGKISISVRRIYCAVAENGTLPLHVIKQLAGFNKDEKSKFDSSLTELQMRMYLTMSGNQQKLSKKGDEYGWSSTVFCTVEHFWGSDVIKKASSIRENEAIDKITEQILKLNPSAHENKIIRFIKG